MTTVGASITIHIEPGENLAEVVAEALRRLEGLGGEATFQTHLGEPSPAQGANQPATVWTDENCDRVVSGMTDEGRQALRYMCEHGPNVSFADMMKDQGLDPAKSDLRRVMGGRLSSFGHNLNRLPRQVRNPISNMSGDYKSIDQSAIGPFLAALDRHESQHVTR